MDFSSFDGILLLCFLLFQISSFISLQFDTAPYGKFSDNPNYRVFPKVNGKFEKKNFKIFFRFAFGLQESASFIFFIYTLFKYDFFAQPDLKKSICALAFIAHYFHRFLIYPFRTHSMSDSNVLIVILAFGFTATNGYLNAKDLLAESVNSNIFIFTLGLVLFVYGFYINFESDSILIKLRSKATPEKKYFIPNEGYFKYVASANYFGEIIEWFGFFLMCMNLASFVFLFGTLSNLVPRARQTKLWYIEKFGDQYPKDRTAIFPFLF
jgi:hypothetical protein